MPTTRIDFARRLTSNVFPSMQDDDVPSDESSYNDEDDERNNDDFGLSAFDPLGFSKSEFATPSTNVFRTTSNRTDRTEQESHGWLYGEEEMVLDECYYTEDDEGTMTAREDGIELLVNDLVDDQGIHAIGAKTIIPRKNHRRGKRRRQQRKRQHKKQRWYYDNTTLGLLVLVTTLTIILGFLMVFLPPVRNNDNNASNANNSNNNNNTTTDSVDSDIPRPPHTPNVFVPSIPTIPTPRPPSPYIAEPTSTNNEATDSPTWVPTWVPTNDVTTIPASPPTMSPLDNNYQVSQGSSLISPRSMGPLVGHTTHDSAILWAYHESFANFNPQNNYTVDIMLYDFDSNKLVQRIDYAQPRQRRNNALHHTLTNLQPSTSYRYELSFLGDSIGSGSFTTAPSKNSGTKFDYILTSCMNYRQYKNQIVWDKIVEALGKYPDFAIMAGDTVYLQEGLDVTLTFGVDFDRLWFRNWEQRTEPHFANFVRNVPTYGTWNDHEYGDNNGDKYQKGKLKSLRAWEALWPNPGYGDVSTDDGVYYSYYWGNVHYIVTDDHWHRDKSTGNRLGTQQTEWVKNELINSKGIFKVIVIGSDIMERGWTSDLYNIGDVVRENAIDGVVFHAGDIHRNEYKERVTGGFPYMVKQITSSGIAKVWRRPFVHIQVDTEVEDPTMTAYFYGASSQNDITTWSNDPNLRCTSIVGVDRAKEHTCTETIRLSDVSVVSGK